MGDVVYLTRDIKCVQCSECGLNEFWLTVDFKVACSNCQGYIQGIDWAYIADDVDFD